MRFKVADIMSERPGEEYTEEYVTELWAGRESLSAREIAELNIPISDRIWVLSRLLYRLSLHRANRCARLIALSVTERWDCPDIVWWYLVTGDVASSDAARDAAWAAASYAARAAASYAARAAAWAAARDDNDAKDAVWVAAWASARSEHLETIVRAFEVTP